MDRDRAFSAIIYNSKILMVYHNMGPNKRSYWTLPGGGVEDGESLEETAIREAFEETNLHIKIIRFLYKDEWENGFEHCYLAEPLDLKNIKIGYDPELNDVNQIITQVEWKKVKDLKHDKQVSIVLKELTTEELNKYNINLDQ